MVTCTFISRSVSQIRMIRTSPEVMRSPVSCSQSTTIPAPVKRKEERKGVMHKIILYKHEELKRATATTFETHFDQQKHFIATSENSLEEHA